MKYRSGFVSNSSSSSYICEICGRIACGWDIYLPDYEMVSCENDHALCYDHFNNETLQILLEKTSDNYESTNFNSIYCPICNFIENNENNITLKYLEKTGRYNKEEILNELKEKYKNYKNFFKDCFK